MMPREGSVIADRYRLQRKVGGGRVSATWRVQDEMTDAPCAVKLLHRSMHKNPEALTRFSLEERLARELAGTYFPERVGSGSWNSLRYIAWRWYEGESLRAMFERNPKQDAPTVHSIVQETCKALNIVHAAGYTHGDLKPENLFFADGGEGEAGRQLKLLGFDVAARISPAGLSFQTRRKAGEIVGTPLYLSPDLVLGRTPKGGQADLWALGVIVYEALTGRAPFLGKDMAEVLKAILDRRAPKPSSVTDTLPGTFDLWWAQALEQDFGSATEFASSLSRALSPALRSSHTQRSALLPERQLSAESAPPGRVSQATEPSGTANSARAPQAEEPALALERSRAADTPAEAPTAKPPAEPAEANGAALAAKLIEPPANAEPTAPAGAGNESIEAAAKPPKPSSSSSEETQSAPTNGLRELGGRAGSSLVAPVRAIGGEPAAGGNSRESSGTFAPFPSPLRDLGAGASRKTLVGITPPASLHALQRAQHGAPATSSSALARVNGEPSGSAVAGVIEGAPCKAIEVSEVRAPLPTPQVSTALMRRPANPTMPFPRPRFAARPAPREPEPTHVEAGGGLALGGGFVPTETSPGAWRENTRTLRFVLTSRDHKSQRIAAVLVCAAAALVIFLVYRSPVAGIGTLGESTGALSPVPMPAPSTPGEASPQAPAPGETEEKAAPSEGEVEPSTTAPADGLRGDELAPGLVLPTASEPPKAPPKESPRAAPQRPNPEPVQRSAPAAPSPVRRAPPPRPPDPSPAPSKTQAPKAPPVPTEPPRRPSGEFDFGI